MNFQLQQSSTQLQSSRISGIRIFQHCPEQLYLLYNCLAIEQVTSQIIMSEIEKLLQNYSKNYSIIYIHYDIYNLFKFQTAITQLSAQYLQGLALIYMVQVCPLGKLVTKYFMMWVKDVLKDKFKMYSSLTQFSDSLGARIRQEKQKQKQKSRSLCIPINFKNDKKSNQKLLQNFLSQKQIDSDNIPSNLSIVITRIYSDNKIILSKGLFRTSPSKHDMQELFRALKNSQSPWGYFRSVTNASVLTTLFKKILISFDQLIPVTITEQLYSHYLCDHSRISILGLKSTLAKISQYNKSILIYCIVFLSQILKAKQNNEMTSKSLGVILTPCFFKLKQDSIQSITKIAKMSIILELIIENYTIIFSENHIKQCMQKLQSDKQKFNAIY